LADTEQTSDFMLGQAAPDGLDDLTTACNRQALLLMATSRRSDVSVKVTLWRAIGRRSRHAIVQMSMRPSRSGRTQNVAKPGLTYPRLLSSVGWASRFGSFDGMVATGQGKRSCRKPENQGLACKIAAAGLTPFIRDLFYRASISPFMPPVPDEAQRIEDEPVAPGVRSPTDSTPKAIPPGGAQSETRCR